MTIIDFDYDLEFGFAWIIVNGKSDKDRWHVGCRLKMDSKKETYEKVIIMGDCDHTLGLWGDTNQIAFSHWGENRCMTALFEQAQSSGIELL